ncbi:vWA domain-containing protein [Corynebacterium sp. H130]|uniref:vWA domain-containing protein n=1 Tax=Corynebacterium sp. H130 TaxID=3133444 RepID=UPI00309D3857
MITKLKAALASVLSLVLVACGTDSLVPPGDKASGEIRIVAATELKDMAPLIRQAEKELSMKITLDYPDGTIANSMALKNGSFDGAYDATWFATNKYVDLYNAEDKLGTSTSIATSPIAFGVRQETARSLGWTDKQPTWAEIIEAVKAKKLRFGMTDPSRSNSGFSALVSVATAQADTGAALTTEDIRKVQAPLREFFAGQNLMSGSSGWLEEAFVSDPNRTEAIINYESVLLQMKNSGRSDIQVVVPADGVVTADYPLAPLHNPRSQSAADNVQKLSKWLVEHNGDIVKDTQRRPVDPGTRPHPDHQKNTLIELPFPARQEVADDLVSAFSDDLRSPGRTVFVLDKSGSMTGQRMDSLHQILTELVDGTARTSTGAVGLRDREELTIIAFDTYVAAPQSRTFEKSDQSKRDELKATINGIQPGGGTAVYDALQTAYNEFESGVGKDGKIPSIVLMSDGASNTGADYKDFERFYNALTPEQKRIPVFVILYGESNKQEMESLAKLTGGKTFDATKGDLAAAFKEIRGYQ